MQNALSRGGAVFVQKKKRLTLSALPRLLVAVPLETLRTTLVLIQLLLSKCRIRNSQVTDNTLVNDSHNDIAVPVPQSHVHHAIHFLPARGVKWRAFEQCTELRQSGQGGLIACADDRNAELWGWGCGLFERRRGLIDVEHDAERWVGG